MRGTVGCLAEYPITLAHSADERLRLSSQREGTGAPLSGKMNGMSGFWGDSRQPRGIGACHS